MRGRHSLDRKTATGKQERAYVPRDWETYISREPRDHIRMGIVSAWSVRIPGGFIADDMTAVFSV